MRLLQILHRQVRVARVFGIPVRIDYRWFIVFALSVWVIAMNFEHGIDTASWNFLWPYATQNAGHWDLCMACTSVAKVKCKRNHDIQLQC